MPAPTAFGSRLRRPSWRADLRMVVLTWALSVETPASRAAERMQAAAAVTCGPLKLVPLIAIVFGPSDLVRRSTRSPNAVTSGFGFAGSAEGPRDENSEMLPSRSHDAVAMALLAAPGHDNVRVPGPELPALAHTTCGIPLTARQRMHVFAPRQ